MKRKTFELSRRIIFALIVLVLVIVVVSTLAEPVALAAGEAIPRYVIASGGGTSSSGAIVIQDTIGQPVVGVSNATGTGMSAGYWYSIVTSTLNQYFLPVISK